MKNIVVLGDSFTFGQGCSDRTFYIDRNTGKQVGDPNLMYNGPSQHCWASLLQQDFSNYRVINLAKPGIDNVTVAMTAHKHINTDTKLVIFSSAPYNRLQVNHPEHNDVTWVLSFDHPFDNNEYKNAKKSFLTHLFNDEAFINISVCALLSIYGLSLSVGTKCLLSISQYQKLKIKSSTFKHIIKEAGIDHITSVTEGKYYAPCRHLNDAGHKLYYETIVKPRVSALL